MSERNATASWSGFSHQGKIGLLIGLRKIISLNGQDLLKYVVEQETKEDVCLKFEEDILEAHQVKAYMSSNSVSSYKKALREFEHVTSGENYLHTIRNITDWDDLTEAENPYKVRRYDYFNQNHCPLNEIESLILREIGAVLKLVGSENSDNEAWCKHAYNEYLALLDERIRIQHFKGKKSTYCVSIRLDEILNLVVSPPSNSKMIICSIRKEIYRKYVEFLYDLEESYEEENSLEEQHEKAITGIIELFCRLNDKELEEFLCQIFPSTTNGKKLSSCSLTDDFFVGKDFYSTFIKTLIDISAVMPTVEGGTYPHYKIDKNYLVTALNEQEARQKRVAIDILENDKLNTVRYEADFIINEHLSGKLGALAPKSIPRGHRLIDQIDIELIPRKDATIKLNK